MRLYLYVSKDKYELPMIVADSAGELAKMLGVQTNTIYSGISNERAGRWPSRYKVVEVDDADICDHMPDCNHAGIDSVLCADGYGGRGANEK